MSQKEIYCQKKRITVTKWEFSLEKKRYIYIKQKRHQINGKILTFQLIWLKHKNCNHAVSGEIISQNSGWQKMENFITPCPLQKVSSPFLKATDTWKIWHFLQCRQSMSGLKINVTMCSDWLKWKLYELYCHYCNIIA